jgi:hypothetical protein
MNKFDTFEPEDVEAQYNELMNCQKYLLICEQVCRNVFNRLEELELYAEPSMGDYEHFAAQVKKNTDVYRDALEALMVREFDAEAVK